MKILKVIYLENGYFEIKYDGITTPIIQDINAIKMNNPSEVSLKDLLLFTRKLKLEKLANKEFDDLEYRNHIVFEDKTQEEEMKRMLAQMAKQVGYTPKQYSGIGISSRGYGIDANGLTF